MLDVANQALDLVRKSPDQEGLRTIGLLLLAAAGQVPGRPGDRLEVAARQCLDASWGRAQAQAAIDAAAAALAKAGAS